LRAVFLKPNWAKDRKKVRHFKPEFGRIIGNVLIAI
jgi:hypothetical protein